MTCRFVTVQRCFLGLCCVEESHSASLSLVVKCAALVLQAVTFFPDIRISTRSSSRNSNEPLPILKTLKAFRQNALHQVRFISQQARCSSALHVHVLCHELTPVQRSPFSLSKKREKTPLYRTIGFVSELVSSSVSPFVPAAVHW